MTAREVVNPRDCPSRKIRQAEGQPGVCVPVVQLGSQPRILLLGWLRACLSLCLTAGDQEQKEMTYSSERLVPDQEGRHLDAGMFWTAFGKALTALVQPLAPTPHQESAVPAGVLAKPPDPSGKDECLRPLQQ